MRDTEQTEHVRHGIVWLHDAPGVIGALIHQHAVAHRHNSSITHGRYFNVVDLLAGMNRGAKMLTPVFDPLDWLTEAQCYQRYDYIFGIGARLHAKSPADIRRHHTDTVRRPPECLGQRTLHKVRKLRGAPDCQTAIEAVRIADQPAAF